MSGKTLEEIIDRQRREIDVGGGMFRTRIFRVSELVNMLQSGKLQLIGGKPFKRWSLSHKSRVIESLILGLPADTVIIDGSESCWYMVDGAEFISAIRDYVNGSFRLSYVNFDMSEYAGAKFSELPLNMQSRLANLEIIATVLNPDTPDIHKLGVYNASLLKIGKERVLWSCTEAVYPESFKKIQSLASVLDVDNPHLLWRLMIAIFFDQRFVTGEFSSFINLGGTRYDMFESLLLDRIDVVIACVRQRLSGSSGLLTDMARFVQAAIDDDSQIVWTEKKRTVFTIVTALVGIASPGISQDGFVARFKRAWKRNLGVGVGHLYRDYAAKSSAIYNYMTR